MRNSRERSFDYKVVTAIFILGNLWLVQSCSATTIQEMYLHQRKSKIYSLAYGHNPLQNGTFLTNRRLLPNQVLRAWEGWGVYLSSDCVIRLAKVKEDYIKKTIWIKGPGLENDTAKNCFAEIAHDGDFNMYYSDGTFAAPIIQHPWALQRVSSKVGYELLFIKDSVEWQHHLTFELRHYNSKVPHVTLWQDLLTIID